MQKIFLAIFGLLFLGFGGTLLGEYVKPPTISEKVWTQLTPYLLPENHSIKKKLDQIFKRKRPTLNHESMRKAGFSFIIPEDSRRLICAKHRKLKGYLIKTYVDEQGTSVEYVGWLQRIKGALQIQKCIDKYDYNKIMKVPQKWIYPLPGEPTGALNFILVVEDMHILNPEGNTAAYLFNITKTKLNALYVVLTENLLIDSIYLDNIPFSKDGKIAFIDTEHYNETSRRLRLEWLTKRFTPSMALYWTSLIANYNP